MVLFAPGYLRMFSASDDDPRRRAEFYPFVGDYDPNAADTQSRA